MRIKRDREKKRSHTPSKWALGTCELVQGIGRTVVLLQRSTNGQFTYCYNLMKTITMRPPTEITLFWESKNIKAMEGHSSVSTS